MSVVLRRLTLALLPPLIACSDVATKAPLEPQLHSFAGSAWSEPVHLDAPINSPARELGAQLAPDELSLYFGSDRPGGVGAFDIWVSRRACRDCPWGAPANLGSNINSAGGDGNPALSPDGLRLFFSGSRAGGHGGEDVWVSHRTDPSDDLGWGTPVNLGPSVNTAGNEGGPSYVPAAAGGQGNLYFSRNGDIYQARVGHGGEALAPAIPVAELNTAENENTPTVRRDGREILFWSNRAGGMGGADIWTATRRSPADPWSAPSPLGARVNTPGADLEAKLSGDGQTLLFAAGANARPSLGFQDIWMSTRTPGGQ